MTETLLLKHEILPVFNIALHLNDIRLIRFVEVNNPKEKDSGKIKIRIETDVPIIEEFEHDIVFIPQKTSASVPLQNLKIRRTYLNKLSENEYALLTIKLFEDDLLIQTVSEKIIVHTLDYFSGFNFFPQILATYITPNHPYIYFLKRKALDFLEKNKQHTAFEGYQSYDPGRVLQIMSAVFSAVKNEEIAYSSLPPGYENAGQRIRLLHTINNQRFGNCIDLSLLFAACFEAIDLHPVIIITQGHAFVGCWLQEDTFSETVNDDKTAITKRLAKGIKELAVVEATTVCKGQNITFTDAVNIAETQLIGRETFILSVDVKRARAERIRPLPLQTEANVIILDESQTISRNTSKMQTQFDIGTIYQNETGEQKTRTKQEIWQRKLLDLSLRNSLLNIRMSRNMLQLVDVDVHHMEDRLSDGKSFTIHPNPGAELLRRYNVFMEQQHTSSALYELATEEMKRNRLLTYYHQLDLENILSFIHKNAKLSIEESGSSTLYLAIGLLRWFDRKMPNQPRYAPIILIPAELSRRSVNSPFNLKSREEEAMINITLLELLRQEYQMNLSNLGELPTDEKGVDVARVMGIFRRAIMQLKGWDIEEQMILGNFSFSKLILWKDIVVHQNEIIKSPTVRSLIEGSYQKEQNNAGATLDLENIAPSEIALPIPADVSQLEAVIAAQQGNSYILHGPPGTGKSQTITNIIADALYHGRKVLFVAAKKAALDVVHKRMEQIGLDVFSLELHSNKSRKSDVLQQLSRTLEVAKRTRNFDFEKEAQRLSHARKEISHYVDILHKKQRIGFSLYDSIVLREQYLHHHFEDISIPGILHTDQILFQKWEDWLPQFGAIIKSISHPATHPFAQFNLKHFSADLQSSIQSQTINLLELLPIEQSNLSGIIQKLQFPFEIKTINEWKRFQDAITLWKTIPDTHLDLCTFIFNRENIAILNDWIHHFNLYREQVNILLKDYEGAVLKQDFDTLHLEWKKAEQVWFLPKWLKKNKIKKNIVLYRKDKKINNDTAEIFFSHYQLYSEQKEILSRAGFDSVIPHLKSLYKEHETSVIDIEERKDALAGIAECLSIFGNNAPALWLEAWKKNGFEYISDITQTYSECFDPFLIRSGKVTEAINQYNELTSITWTQDNNQSWMQTAAEQLQNINRFLPELKDWLNYVNIVRQGETLQLQWLIEAFEQNRFKADDLNPFFQYTVATAIAEQVIASHETLGLFNQKIFESKIEHYKNIAGNFRQITQMEIILKLTAQLPNTGNAIQGSELGILQRAIRSRGRGMSIRRLFDRIPNLLPRLVPCILMSPISVAQYFDVDVNHFDLVIFDEASQLPTCEAVSALSRARQAIVVGDPKQMPPTSFFAASKVDEENIEVEDLESILDDCLALSMPSKYLLRHYRSKHESLIAYSNANYYDNKLLTFPSADDLSRKVKWHHVQGFYDKGKTRQNRSEADAIVAYVQQHYSNEAERNKSIGIVTFSQVQQSLIEDKLQSLFMQYPETEQFIMDSTEPLFVKNLENVQGDERDIILFSVCYGPDEEGKVSMNFGPLNREGGWRRLNVAITRARYEMHIFSTLLPDQIDLNRTASEGVAGLKGFLLFAEKGILSLPSNHSDAFLYANQLAKNIAKALEERGLQVKTNIGTSGFKLDIGILHPDNPNQYILGIITDGKYYLNAQTSNDREMVMPSVLKGLGWNIHRVWTMDWYFNKKQVTENIMNLVEELKNKPVTSATEEKIRVQSIAPVADENTDSDVQTNNAFTSVQREYVAYAISNTAEMNADTIYLVQNRQLLQAHIRNTVQTESPISKSYLFKRVLQSWNISRAGARLDRLLTEIIADLQIKSTEHRQPFYWSIEMQPEELDYYRSNDIEKRNIEDIAPEELWIAVKEAIHQNISIEEDELIRFIARQFGFSKAGRQIDSYLRYVISYAAQYRNLVRENGRVRLG